MKTSTKLPSEERRANIIAATRRVFAKKGFHGTTTRDLANAAGVSEALLYKHFPNKEALFAAMQVSCYDAQFHGQLEELMETEPASSETLVLMVRYLISHVVHGSIAHDDEMAIYSRLMLRSFAEDGDFARLMLSRPMSNWIPKCEECLQAAIAAGDAVNGTCPRLSGWFAYQLATMIRTYLQPETPVVDYEVTPDALIEQAVCFILRGMGLKDETIKRCNSVEAFSRFTA